MERLVFNGLGFGNQLFEVGFVSVLAERCCALQQQHVGFSLPHLEKCLNKPNEKHKNKPDTQKKPTALNPQALDPSYS